MMNKMTMFDVTDETAETVLNRFDYRFDYLENNLAACRMPAWWATDVMI